MTQPNKPGPSCVSDKGMQWAIRFSETFAEDKREMALNCFMTGWDKAQEKAAAPGEEIKESADILYNEIVALRKERDEARAELAKAVDALERIAQTDTSEHAPTAMWLNSWRNNTKAFAQRILDELKAREFLERVGK